MRKWLIVFPPISAAALCCCARSQFKQTLCTMSSLSHGRLTKNKKEIPSKFHRNHRCRSCVGMIDCRLVWSSFFPQREQKRDISMTLYVLHGAGVGRRGENFDDGKKKAIRKNSDRNKAKKVCCCCHGWEMDDGMEQRRNKNTRWSAKKREESENSSMHTKVSLMHLLSTRIVNSLSSVINGVCGGGMGRDRLESFNISSFQSLGHVWAWGENATAPSDDKEARSESNPRAQ